MSIIPRSLPEWNQERIAKLLEAGIFETDVFEFKERLPVDPAGKERLKKTFCAFANSSGGFIVFGIVDKRDVPSQERIVGIDANFELPRYLGDLMTAIEPTVAWEFLNPPIQLASGKRVHVCSIPQSSSAPHCFQSTSEALWFHKRTNRGNEPMSPNEIRMSYLNFYEKRLKLELLSVELGSISTEIAAMFLPRELWETTYNVHGVGITVVESVLGDTYTILARDPTVYAAVLKVRSQLRVLNARIMHFTNQVSLPTSDRARLAREHNEYLYATGHRIIVDLGEAMSKISALLKQ